jgi:hypothetical protein
MEARAIIEQRRLALQALKAKCTNTSSIEISVSNSNSSNSIELPPEIEQLIVGEMFRQARINRYKKLIREGQLDILLQIAELARTKKNPAHYFAHAAGKAQWSQTLACLAKAAKVVEAAARIVQKLGSQINEKVVYKFIWAGANVERWADTAKETGRNKAKYFSWLCQREVMYGADR